MDKSKNCVWVIEEVGRGKQKGVGVFFTRKAAREYRKEYFLNPSFFKIVKYVPSI